MSKEIHRHDMSDNACEKIKPHVIGEKGKRGGNARNTRQFIDGVFWILRTGAPWRDLPSEYGHWKNVHRRYCRWRDKGIWENILERVHINFNRINGLDFFRCVDNNSAYKLQKRGSAFFVELS